MLVVVVNLGCVNRWWASRGLVCFFRDGVRINTHGAPYVDDGSTNAVTPFPAAPAVLSFSSSSSSSPRRRRRRPRRRRRRSSSSRHSSRSRICSRSGNRNHRSKCSVVAVVVDS